MCSTHNIEKIILPLWNDMKSVWSGLLLIKFSQLSYEYKWQQEDKAKLWLYDSDDGRLYVAYMSQMLGNDMKQTA